MEKMLLQEYLDNNCQQESQIISFSMLPLLIFCINMNEPEGFPNDATLSAPILH